MFHIRIGLKLCALFMLFAHVSLTFDPTDDIVFCVSLNGTFAIR